MAEESGDATGVGADEAADETTPAAADAAAAASPPAAPAAVSAGPLVAYYVDAGSGGTRAVLVREAAGDAVAVVALTGSAEASGSAASGPHALGGPLRDLLGTQGDDEGSPAKLLEQRDAFVAAVGKSLAAAAPGVSRVVVGLTAWHRDLEEGDRDALKGVWDGIRRVATQARPEVSVEVLPLSGPSEAGYELRAAEYATAATLGVRAVGLLSLGRGSLRCAFGEGCARGPPRCLALRWLDGEVMAERDGADGLATWEQTCVTECTANLKEYPVWSAAAEAASADDLILVLSGAGAARAALAAGLLSEADTGPRSHALSDLLTAFKELSGSADAAAGARAAAALAVAALEALFAENNAPYRERCRVVIFGERGVAKGEPMQVSWTAGHFLGLLGRDVIGSSLPAPEATSAPTAPEAPPAEVPTTAPADAPGATEDADAAADAADAAATSPASAAADGGAPSAGGDGDAAPQAASEAQAAQALEPPQAASEAPTAQAPEAAEQAAAPLSPKAAEALVTPSAEPSPKASAPASSPLAAEAAAPAPAAAAAAAAAKAVEVADASASPAEATGLVVYVIAPAAAVDGEAALSAEEHRAVATAALRSGAAVVLSAASASAPAVAADPAAARSDALLRPLAEFAIGRFRRPAGAAGVGAGAGAAAAAGVAGGGAEAARKGGGGDARAAFECLFDAIDARDAGAVDAREVATGLRSLGFPGEAAAAAEAVESAAIIAGAAAGPLERADFCRTLEDAIARPELVVIFPAAAAASAAAPGDGGGASASSSAPWPPGARRLPAEGERLDADTLLAAKVKEARSLAGSGAHAYGVVVVLAERGRGALPAEEYERLMRAELRAAQRGLPEHWPLLWSHAPAELGLLDAAPAVRGLWQLPKASATSELQAWLRYLLVTRPLARAG